MATAQVRRYMVKDVTSDEFVDVLTVPAWKVFVLSWIWTFAENTIHARIIPASWESVEIADSLDESNRILRWLVLDSQDTLQVKMYTDRTKWDVVVCGELYDR